MNLDLYCIVLYCIVLYCIVLYCIVLYCIVLHWIGLDFIVLYCIVLYCIVLYLNPLKNARILFHCEHVASFDVKSDKNQREHKFHPKTRRKALA